MDTEQEKQAVETDAESADALSDEELTKQFKASTKLRDEFGDVETFIAFKRAEANGQVKISSNRESFDEDF